MGLEDKIVDWLNEKFPSGIADYGAYHALTHPWIIVRNWGHHIKWAWQRVFRGWDDRAVWSIDMYFAKTIAQMVRRLAKINKGYPVNLSMDDESLSPEQCAQKWVQILTEIAEGFEDYFNRETDCFGLTESEKFKKAFDLFREYYSNLWD